MNEAGGAIESKRPWTWYLQEKIVVVFVLGFSGGLPFPLVYATLTYWLNEAGIEKSTISMFAWIGFAYALKFLWSPLVDRLHLPVLTTMFGRRRSWLLFSQVLIAVSLAMLSTIDPVQAISAFAFVALAVAISSATQDMAIDAYRIECAPDEMQGLLAAAYRHHLHWSEFIGGDVVVTMTNEWQLRLNASDVEVKPRMDDPVELVTARVRAAGLVPRPKLPRVEDDERRAYVLVVDSSRSMFGEAHKRATTLTARMVRELDHEDRFTVLACDSSCRRLPGGLQEPGRESAQKVASWLEMIQPEGASDPTAAIREARGDRDKAAAHSPPP